MFGKVVFGVAIARVALKAPSIPDEIDAAVAELLNGCFDPPARLQ